MKHWISVGLLQLQKAFYCIDVDVGQRYCASHCASRQWYWPSHARGNSLDLLLPIRPGDWLPMLAQCEYSFSTNKDMNNQTKYFLKSPLKLSFMWMVQLNPGGQKPLRMNPHNRFKLSIWQLQKDKPIWRTTWNVELAHTFFGPFFSTYSSIFIPILTLAYQNCAIGLIIN